MNGAPLEEPYVRHREDADMAVVSVPTDAYFVLGDNRPVSDDSRQGWVVAAEDVVGQPWISYWPPASWGNVPAAPYEE